MSYSLYKAFVGYVTYIEHFRDLEHYRIGAEVIRNGLPSIEKGKPGWRDILEVKNFVEWILTEEDRIVEQVAESDGASTIEALTDQSRRIVMENPDEIKKKIFQG